MPKIDFSIGNKFQVNGKNYGTIINTKRNRRESNCIVVTTEQTFMIEQGDSGYTGTLFELLKHPPGSAKRIGPFPYKNYEYKI
jgi:deoxycytidine triphosphate deaminase